MVGGFQFVEVVAGGGYLFNGFFWVVKWLVAMAGSAELWLSWIGGCDVGVVGLLFGFGRGFWFVGVVGGSGGVFGFASGGGGGWRWLWVFWV